MQESIANNRQIAKNTLMLYVRMALTIVVQLYTVPIVLRNLGASDYGLYNVVGGIAEKVSLFRKQSHENAKVLKDILS